MKCIYCNNIDERNWMGGTNFQCVNPSCVVYDETIYKQEDNYKQEKFVCSYKTDIFTYNKIYTDSDCLNNVLSTTTIDPKDENPTIIYLKIGNRLIPENNTDTFIVPGHTPFIFCERCYKILEEFTTQQGFLSSKFKLNWQFYKNGIICK